MKYLVPLKTLRRFLQIVCLLCAAFCNLANANPDFSFTPGHIYSTWTFGNTTNVIEYNADGTFLDSLTIPSLLQDDELRGIAFGPDGLLYAVMVHFADSGFQVLALIARAQFIKRIGWTEFSSGEVVRQGRLLSMTRETSTSRR